MNVVPFTYDTESRCYGPGFTSSADCVATASNPPQQLNRFWVFASRSIDAFTSQPGTYGCDSDKIELLWWRGTAGHWENVNDVYERPLYPVYTMGPYDLKSYKVTGIQWNTYPYYNNLQTPFYTSLTSFPDRVREMGCTSVKIIEFHHGSSLSHPQAIHSQIMQILKDEVTSKRLTSLQWKKIACGVYEGYPNDPAAQWRNPEFNEISARMKEINASRVGPQLDFVSIYADVLHESQLPATYAEALKVNWAMPFGTAAWMNKYVTVTIKDSGVTYRIE